MARAVSGPPDVPQLFLPLARLVVGFRFLAARPLCAFVENLCTCVPLKLFQQVLKHLLNVLHAKLSSIGATITVQFLCNDASQAPDGLRVSFRRLLEQTLLQVGPVR